MYDRQKYRLRGQKPVFETFIQNPCFKGQLLGHKNGDNCPSTLFFVDIELSHLVEIKIVIVEATAMGQN